MILVDPRFDNYDSSESADSDRNEREASVLAYKSVSIVGRLGAFFEIRSDTLNVFHSCVILAGAVFLNLRILVI